MLQNKLDIEGKAEVYLRNTEIITSIFPPQNLTYPLHNFWRRNQPK